MSGVPAAEKIVFKMISSGTASKAPVVPHTQAQKDSADYKINNAVPLLFNFSGTWFLSLLGAAAIYLPAWFMDNEDNS